MRNLELRRTSPYALSDVVSHNVGSMVNFPNSLTFLVYLTFHIAALCPEASVQRSTLRFIAARLHAAATNTTHPKEHNDERNDEQSFAGCGYTDYAMRCSRMP